MEKILIVDDDVVLLESMSDFFTLLTGLPCIVCQSMDEVLANQSEILGGNVIFAVLDVNLGLGSPSGIDIYHWLSKHHFSGKCVFLTGHAKNHPLVAEAHRLTGIEVFSKPMDIERLIFMIEQQRTAYAKTV